MSKDELGLGKLVERLRAPHTLDIRDIVQVRALLDLVAAERSQAADAITALIAERDALAKALKPFADIADEIERDYGADTPDAQMQFPVLQMRLFRTARSTLNLTVNHDG